VTQTNQLSGAEALVRMLRLHNVDYIFGLCGDTSLPWYDALRRFNRGMTHVLCRDERSAGYMADAYARVSGKVGVCEGPSGGGATYILPGLAEANESSIPVLSITTDISVSSRGRYTLTELDQEGLFRPVTKWNKVLNRAADLPRTIRSAFTHMTTGRPGAAHIGLPFDVQTDTVDEEEIWADNTLGRFPSRRVAPDPQAVGVAADLLLGAERPIFICGGGVVISGAETELQILAERLGAAVATTISGRGSISDHHPLAVGVIGSNGGTPQTRAVVENATLVIFIGCRAGSVTTERWRFPAPRTCKIIHIDVDPAVIGANYRADAALVGDARLCLCALNSACNSLDARANPPETMERSVGKAKASKFENFRQLAASDEIPIRPERLVADLQRVLPSNAIIVADAGTPCPYFSAYYLQSTPGRHFISNRAHGALGYALSAAGGACFGRPGAKCVSVMGDGSFGFTVGELEAITRYKLPITFVVVSNATYGWIKAGQKTRYGGQYFSVDFGRSDHARIAEAFGVKSWTVDDPSRLRSTLEAAVNYPGPSLVDVISQPLHEARAPVSEWIA
jgi:acetolactate synthase-1/2/3 large subunit